MNGKEIDLLEKLFAEKIDSQNKVIRSGLKGVRQYVDAGFETQNIHLESIIENNRSQNGKLNDHDFEIESIKEEIKPVIKINRWSKKKKFWFILISILFVFVMVGEMVYHIFGLGILIELLKKTFL